MPRLLLALTAIVAFVACDKPSPDDGRISVVASFYPMAEIASRVGGDRVKVTNLTPVGVEPHDIELTTRQVDQLQDADLVIYLGKGFQPAVAEIAERRSKGSLDVLAGDLDPHFWLDPTLMVRAVDRVTSALGDTFMANAHQYKDGLDALDDEYQRGLADCERKEIVTSHEAFSSLARRYGLTELAIAGLSPESEPDARTPRRR